MIDTADDLRAHADAVVRLDDGDMWMQHVYHAIKCRNDSDSQYIDAALAGMRRWQCLSQGMPRLSRYPL